MRKHFTSCLFFCAITVTNQAQLGLSSVGILPALGNTILGEGSLLGKSSVATSVTCYQQCSVLAVTGLQLEGKRQNKNNVALTWYTLTETNNKGFFVQRSLGSSNAFQTTAFVNGKGNSNSKINYDLMDVNGFSGITAYRIEQQNNDGSTAYSNVVSVAGIANDRFVIYPNPSSGMVVLLLPSNYTSSYATVTLFDASGRKVYQNTYSAGSGSFIQINNLTGLQTGTYQLSVSSDKDKTLHGKLVVAK